MAAARQDSGRLFSSVLLGQVRSRFAYVEEDPYQGKRIFFENAGGSLMLQSAQAAVRDLAGLPDNIGRQTRTSVYLEGVLEKGLHDASMFLNAGTGTVFGGESTTGNLFRIVDAVTAGRRGSNIVCTNLEHAALYNATQFYAEQRGLEWRVAALDPRSGAVPPDTIAALVDAGTVLVGVIHASNITGVKNDIPAIAAAVRRLNPETIVLVDGAQHAPHGVVDLEELSVDAYVFAPYKMFAAPGLAFGYLSPRMAELPHPRLLGKPADHWELGTRNPAGYAAFSAVCDYLCWLGQQERTFNERRDQLVAGMNAIASHESALVERLLRGTAELPGLADNPKVQVYGSRDAGPNREAVLALNIGGMSAKDFVGRCARQGIIVHDRQSDAYSRHTLQALGITECVRVSLSHYNSPAEVDALLHAVTQTTSRQS